MPPDYLILGHVARDLVPGGAMLGGTCSYAGLTAYRLGRRTAALTSYGPDLPGLSVLNGVVLENLPHSRSTTFENLYLEGVRYQKWLASGRTLTLEALPAAWRMAPIVHLAPIAQEVHPRVIGGFPETTLVCATGQGWLRGKDKENNVIYAPHPELDIWLPRLDALVLSLADVSGDRAALEGMLTAVPLGVETIGPEGCLVYHQGRVTHVPVQPEEEVDPTGAGDIFAAAFFVHYQTSQDPVVSAQFANACASLSVRRMGIEGIPRLPDVERRWAELYSDTAVR